MKRCAALLLALMLMTVAPTALARIVLPDPCAFAPELQFEVESSPSAGMYRWKYALVKGDEAMLEEVVKEYALLLQDKYQLKVTGWVPATEEAPTFSYYMIFDGPEEEDETIGVRMKDGRSEEWYVCDLVLSCYYNQGKRGISIFLDGAYLFQDTGERTQYQAPQAEPVPAQPSDGGGERPCWDCVGGSCSDCGGRGYVRHRVIGQPGEYTTETCSTCYGNKKCPTCKGDGWLD